MQRIIVLLLFLLLPLNVYATTEYRYYLEEKIYSNDYYFESENDLAYPYKSDIFITETSDWLDSVIESKPNRIIETKEEVVNTDKIRFICLCNININESKFLISNIEVYVDNKKIDVSISTSNFPSKFYDKIPGTSGYDLIRALFQYNLKYLIIDLKDLYDYRDVGLKLDFSDINNQHYYFEIIVNDNGNMEDSFYTKVIDEDINGDYRYDLDIDEDFTKHILYKSYYRFIDTKYKYYRLERTYLDGYYPNLDPPYIKDENDYISKQDETTTEETFVEDDNNIEEDTTIDEEGPTENVNNNEEQTTNENISIEEEKNIKTTPINDVVSIKNENIEEIIVNSEPEELSKKEIATEITNKDIGLIRVKDILSVNERKLSKGVVHKYFSGIIVLFLTILFILIIKFVERKKNKVLSNMYKNK